MCATAMGLRQTAAAGRSALSLRGTRQPDDELLLVDAGFSRGAFASHRLAPFVRTDKGSGTEPQGVLLTHEFAPDAATASGGTPLLLVTLLMPRADISRAAMADAFGSVAPAALRPDASSGDKCLCTDVLTGPAHGATRLSEADVAAMTQAARRRLRQAQKLQILAAVAASVRAEATGCFLALHGCLQHAGASPQALEAGEVLASLVRRHLARAAASSPHPSSAATGGGGPTQATCRAKYMDAVGLEHSGRFEAAAVLYKENLEDDLSYPERRLLASPPMNWSYYGLALKKAGRFDAAAAAYTLGLMAMEVGRVSPDTPAWRETLRLTLGYLKFTLAQCAGSEKDTQARSSSAHTIVVLRAEAGPVSLQG